MEQAKLADEQKNLAESRRENKRLQDELSTLRVELNRAKLKIHNRERELEEEQNRTRIESQKLEKAEGDKELLKVWNNKQVEAAEKRAEGLKEEVNRLLPGAHDEQIIVSFYEYHNRLSAAARQSKVNGLLPRLEISIGRDGIGELLYHYEPSTVASAIDKLNVFIQKARENKEELGKDRVLDKNMLFGFARVLGYHNLYSYLVYLLHEKPDHRDSRFLRALCDLSVPSWQVEALAAGLDVVSWLAKHMPLKDDVPNSPCCFTFFPNMKESIINYGPKRKYKEDVATGQANLYWEAYDGAMRGRIAETISALEKQNLLDFRESLFVIISAIAPYTPDELNLPEQEPPSPEEAALADPQPYSPSKPVTKKPGTPAHQFRLLNYHFDPELFNGVHIIQYEYRGPNINVPVKAELAFNNAGEILTETEEDE